MKKVQQSGLKFLAPAAAAVALAAASSAQRARSDSDPRVAEGRPIPLVSLEDDIHDGRAVRGRKIVLNKDDHQRELELKFRMRPNPGAEPQAIIPMLEEMRMTLALENGAPGAIAVINLDTGSPVARSGGSARYTGFFDAGGEFSVQIPEGTPVRGFFARGEQVTWWGFARREHSGSPVRPEDRPVIEVSPELDLGEAAHVAYSEWVRFWTDLQFRTDARVAPNELEVSAGPSLQAVASSATAPRAVREKLDLLLPQLGGGQTQRRELSDPDDPMDFVTLEIGGGHVQRGEIAPAASALSAGSLPQLGGGQAQRKKLTDDDDPTDVRVLDVIGHGRGQRRTLSDDDVPTLRNLRMGGSGHAQRVELSDPDDPMDFVTLEIGGGRTQRRIL